MTTGVPPSLDTFFNPKPSKNPTQAPSGETKGYLGLFVCAVKVLAVHSPSERATRRPETST